MPLLDMLGAQLEWFAHITVPAMEVRYVPGSGEAIKFAFIR
jgi:hypothetical protein